VAGVRSASISVGGGAGLGEWDLGAGLGEWDSGDQGAGPSRPCFCLSRGAGLGEWDSGVQGGWPSLDRVSVCRGVVGHLDLLVDRGAVEAVDEAGLLRFRSM
jgi:hypothetical protein